MNKFSEIPIFENARKNEDRTAVVAADGEFTYKRLLDYSGRAASCLLNGADDLEENRVAFIVPAGFQYAAILWGIWRAGGIAVPLYVHHPSPELEYVIEDSDASILIAHPDFEEKARPIAEKLGMRLLNTTEVLKSESAKLPEIDMNRRVLILYTSGIAGVPKGVVTTHGNIEAQVTALISAWNWTPEDRLLHLLPLHHCTGVVVLLTTALRAGSTCEILPEFDAEQAWKCIIRGGITLFMAVPTVYVKLTAHWEKAAPENQKEMTAACKKIRLMISGSAPLPVTVIDKWKEVSGHIILERYGMTELAGAITYRLDDTRIPGCVGRPLDGVEARLVDDEGIMVKAGTPGELQIKGPLVFLEYWGKPGITEQSFRDGWFSTGDVAIVEKTVYRILGRKSVDIIKTGGFKVSALEIENALLNHPGINQCAVVGIDDPEWGERVCAALVVNDGSRLDLDSLREWAKERLAAYKIPTRIKILNSLPRTAMGKTSKKEITRLFEDDYRSNTKRD